MHCNLEAIHHHASHSELLLATFVLSMGTNCYFRVSDQNSDTAVRFINHDFLNESNKLAIRQRFRLIFSPAQIKNLLYAYLRSI